MANMDDGRGVVFDFDGVLVDTGWAHKRSWYDLAEAEGLVMTDAFFYRTFGMQNRRIIPMLVGREVSEQEIERMGDWKERRYREIVVEDLEVSQDVHTLLEGLDAAGFRMAVGSSAPRENLDMILERLGLARFFGAVVSKEDTHRGKPDPETFLIAAERIAIAPCRCVVVEDAVQGVEAGKAGGMAVVAVTSTRSRSDLEHAGADVVVDSLGELTPEDLARLLEP